MLAKEAMDHGASGVTIFSAVSNAHQKATLFAPAICPLEIMPKWPPLVLTAQFRGGACMLGLRGWPTRPN
jgi:hypothetical protein